MEKQIYKYKLILLYINARLYLQSIPGGGGLSTIFRYKILFVNFEKNIKMHIKK